MGALSKLDAVNRMLRASGEQPVNTLLTVSGDALLAEQILDEVTLEYQITSQTFNSFEEYIIPDANGEIALPENTIHIDTIDEHAGVKVAPRGNRLFWYMHYNTPKNTFDFSELSLSQGLKVRRVLKTEFEDMPTPPQFAVADEAARRYQMMTMADTNTDGLLRNRAAQSRALARADDIRQRDASIFTFQSGLANHIARGARRGWRNGRGY